MKKTILFILMSCILFSNIGCTLLNPSEKIFSIENYNLQITADSTFSEENDSNFDLQITNDKSYISIFAFKYIDLANGQTPLDIFDIQNEIAFTLRTEVDLIEEAKSQSFSNHTITQALYSAKNNNVKNYYATYLIDFPEYEVFAWVLITTTPSYFNKNREYLNDIVCSLTTIELNSHE